MTMTRDHRLLNVNGAYLSLFVEKSEAGVDAYVTRNGEREVVAHFDDPQVWSAGVSTRWVLGAAHKALTERGLDGIRLSNGRLARR